MAHPRFREKKRDGIVIQFPANEPQAGGNQRAGENERRRSSDDRADQSSVEETLTGEIMEGGPRRDVSTPGEGVLTSKITDRDAATG